MNKSQTHEIILDWLKRKETISILLIVAFMVGAFVSMFISPQFYQSSVHEGDVALKDTYAPYDFSYYWGIDEESTQLLKDKALRRVPYVLKRNLQAEEKMKNRLEKFFDLLEIEKDAEVPPSEKIVRLKDRIGEGVPDKDLKILLDYDDPVELRNNATSILHNVLLSGYLGSEDINVLKEEKVQKVSIPGSGGVKKIEYDSLDQMDKGSVQERVDAYAQELFPQDRKINQAVAELMLGYISPNLELDSKATEVIREDALKNVQPVFESWDVKKNELIIERGKRVNARHITQISQIRRLFRPGTTPTFFIGVLLLFFLLGLIAVIHTIYVQKKNFLAETKNVAIVLLNMFIMIMIADFVMKSPQPSYFVPMAGMGMLITLLVGFNVAFLCVVLMGILISLLVGGQIEMMLVLMVGSIVGMYAVKGARRRAQILWAGLLVGVAKFVSIICIGLINSMDMDFFVKDGVWGIASGLLSGFIVMGLLPVFEYLFKTPTNISLLELSDLNHPLLKKLALEAPGTYHHSIMVGNLAEVACDAIGANSLLARVGSYYHDIGKIPKSEYFSENEMSAGSRHSNLAPSMSALIIAKHVKEGMEIAKKYKLTNTIMDFITQHHGDSLISYFYQKAMEKTEEGEVLKEEHFRYPGPRPQTKESAIVLLADSVEA
ncbi:HD family phosphohydrolase, partial [Candidatus Omnitrophota bacterium]